MARSCSAALARHCGCRSNDAEPGERYLCEVVLADGSRHVVGVWSPKGPGHTWSVELDQSTVGAQELVVSDLGGSEVATADLS